jgi:hypothetical protein
MELADIALERKCSGFCVRRSEVKKLIADKDGCFLIPYSFSAQWWKKEGFFYHVKSVEFIQQTPRNEEGKNRLLSYMLIEMSKEKVNTTVLLPSVSPPTFNLSLAIKRQMNKNKKLDMNGGKNKQGPFFQSSNGVQAIETPKEIYEKLDKIHHFDFDPCPLSPNFDGLLVAWKKSNFVNPPFRVYLLWTLKAIEECMKGNSSVLLIPANVKSAALNILSRSVYTEYFCFLVNKAWNGSQVCDVCVVYLNANKETPGIKVYLHDFFSQNQFSPNLKD